jgi:outer membrane protein OmpA-like peptidoglycan-associated protein
MRHLALVFSALLLTGCTMGVHKLHDLNPSANDFNSALASEYSAYADSESEQHRYFAAEHYADKGLKALKGETVEPETPDSSLAPEQQQELAEARATIMKLMTPQIKEVAPQQLARSQLLFDCWQHQLSKDLNQVQAPCGEEFKSSLAELQEASDPLVYGKESTQQIAFAFKSTRLDSAGAAALHDIAAGLQGKTRYTVELNAYIGKLAWQRKLSESRITVVRRALVKDGIPENHIRVRKQGSAKAVILSRDTVALNTKVVTVTVKTHKPTAGER